MSIDVNSEMASAQKIKEKLIIDWINHESFYPNRYTPTLRMK